MYGFKLEGGELFKGGFRKHFKLEWNSSQETRLGIQLAKNKAQKSKAPEKQSVVSQKKNRLFRKNNWLFIPVKITTTEIKEFKEERDAQTVYTDSLLNQELHPVSQKPLGIH